jgi:hypothetical protein
MDLRRYSAQLPAPQAAVVVVITMPAKLEVRAVAVVLVNIVWVLLQAEQQHRPGKVMQAVLAALILIRTLAVVVVVQAQWVEPLLVALSQVMVELDYRHLYQVVQHTTQVEVEVVLDMVRVV